MNRFLITIIILPLLLRPTHPERTALHVNHVERKTGNTLFHVIFTYNEFIIVIILVAASKQRHAHHQIKTSFQHNTLIYRLNIQKKIFLPSPTVPKFKQSNKSDYSPHRNIYRYTFLLFHIIYVFIIIYFTNRRLIPYAVRSTPFAPRILHQPAAPQLSTRGLRLPRNLKNQRNPEAQKVVADVRIAVEPIRHPAVPRIVKPTAAADHAAGAA